ncbi:MAG: hypothetical protein LBT40_09625 [Deltaproteobacteria bacterium]|jgi:hypothetical protein|nr:hypothetical protein [Deltaproteobacteria bacterium]
MDKPSPCPGAPEDIRAETGSPDPPASADPQALAARAEADAAALLKDCGDPSSDAASGAKDRAEAFANDSFDRTKVIMDRLLFRISSGEIDRESRFPSDTVDRLVKACKTLDPTIIDIPGKGMLARLFSATFEQYFTYSRQSRENVVSVMDSLEESSRMFLTISGELRDMENSLREAAEALGRDFELGIALEKALEAGILAAEQSGESGVSGAPASGAGAGDKSGAGQGGTEFAREKILFPLRFRLMTIHQLLDAARLGVGRLRSMQRDRTRQALSLDRTRTAPFVFMNGAVQIWNMFCNPEDMGKSPDLPESPAASAPPAPRPHAGEDDGNSRKDAGAWRKEAEAWRKDSGSAALAELEQSFLDIAVSLDEMKASRSRFRK